MASLKALAIVSVALLLLQLTSVHAVAEGGTQVHHGCVCCSPNPARPPPSPRLLHPHLAHNRRALYVVRVPVVCCAVLRCAVLWANARAWPLRREQHHLTAVSSVCLVVGAGMATPCFSHRMAHWSLGQLFAHMRWWHEEARCDVCEGGPNPNRRVRVPRHCTFPRRRVQHTRLWCVKRRKWLTLMCAGGVLHEAAQMGLPS